MNTLKCLKTLVSITFNCGKYTIAFLFFFFSFSSSYATHIKVYKVGQPIVKGLMYLNEKGQPVGFPFEIIEALTQEENISIEWVKGSWSELFQQLLKGEIDLLPGTQITEERQKNLDFLHSSMFTMWSELYVNKNSNFENLSDLQQKKIALVKDDNNSEGFKNYIRGFQIDYQPVYYSSHNEAIAALKKGEVFAMAGPASVLLGDLFEGISRTKLYFNPTDLNIAFKKGCNIDLQRKLNNRLALYKNNPYSPYSVLMKKYGFANYAGVSYIFPFWVKPAIFSLILLLIIGFAFIYLLRRQVDKKTLQLRERQVMLKKALSLGNMGVWTYDYATKKLELVDEVYLIYQLSLGKKLTIEDMGEFIHPDDRQYIVDLVRTSLSNKQGFSVEFRIVVPSGQILYVKQLAVIEYNEKGIASKVIGLTQDITTYKLNQFELIEAKNKAEESDNLKTQFLNNMSHEIRTPMNGIVGFSDLLNTPNLTQEKRLVYTNIIKSSSNKLMHIINNIIEISILTSEKYPVENVSVNIHALLYKLVSLYKPISEEKKIPIILNLHLSDDECFMKCDCEKLNKILTHLLDNAFKFTSSGFVELGYQIVDSRLKFWVRDSGIGISPEYHKTIFNHFSQENREVSFTYGGLGLGLSIAKHYTTILGGNIYLNSVKDKGATFYVDIPYIAVTQHADTVVAPAVLTPEVPAAFTFVVAEDEDINFLYLKTIISDSKLGKFNIIRARNGKDAVDICSANKHVNLVLMDIKMPVMDGYEATREIRKFNSHVPIIAQTAFTASDDTLKVKNAGCNHFITKPMSDENLTHIINTYCKVSV